MNLIIELTTEDWLSPATFDVIPVLPTGCDIPKRRKATARAMFHEDVKASDLFYGESGSDQFTFQHMTDMGSTHAGNVAWAFVADSHHQLDSNVAVDCDCKGVYEDPQKMSRVCSNLAGCDVEPR